MREWLAGTVIIALLGCAGAAVADEVVAPDVAAAAKQRDDLDALGVVFHDPGSMSPPGTEALACATPCTVGTLGATHPYYDVFMSCENGTFTARTGAMHSVTQFNGLRQNVIYLGAQGTPRTSDVAWRVHDNARTYQDPTGGAACIFNPPDTPAEPNSVGIEAEWTRSPMAGVTLLLREEIVAFGTTEADSGIRLTLAATNLSSSIRSVNMGVRWQIDYQNAGDDGPLFATMKCDPLELVTEYVAEHELLPSEIKDFYRIQNNANSPIFSNLTSTAPILGVPDTATPDRLVFAYWPTARLSLWTRTTDEGEVLVDDDSAVIYYRGYLPADGTVIAPGESFRRSVVILTTGQNADCGGFVPGCAPDVVQLPTDQTTCGGSATLDARGVGLRDCAGTIEYTWRDELDNVVSTDPIAIVAPAQTTYYTVRVQCSADAGCAWEETVRVTVQQPPLFSGVSATDVDECNYGIELTWDAATFRDVTGTGVYNVYRSEAGCTAALFRPPLVTGITGLRWVDFDTQAGSVYYYAVEAEDATPGTVCTPRGPHNRGAVARACVVAAAKLAAPPVPDGIYATLRARHVGHDVTLDWTAARALDPGEHFHVLKAVSSPSHQFHRVNGEADLSRAYAENDPAWSLQFFDVRVANICEQLSPAEYPPGWY